MKRHGLLTALFIASVILGGMMAVAMAQSSDTNINYKGQPPPSAIAPSMSAFSQDVCALPVSGAFSGGVFGISGGTVITDANCERIKLAKTLNDLGLKVSAVAVLCEDERVFRAMLNSGSPCPVMGAVGDTALKVWSEIKPDEVKKVYGGKLPKFESVSLDGDKK